MIRKIAAVFFLSAAGVYLAAMVVLYTRQTSLEFAPNSAPIHPPADASRSGLNTVTLHTADNLDLHAWFRKPEAGYPTILMLHGNSGNLDDTRDRIAHLSFPGYGLLALEYRGFGGNPGTLSQTGFAQDADAAMRFLREQGIEPARVVIYGHSMGTGVGTALALRWPVAALVLDAPFTSIADIAQQQYWYTPAGLLLKSKFPVRALLPKLHTPLLILQGAKDKTVPPAMGRADYAIANMPKMFWCAPDAGHNDVLDQGGAAIMQQFLARYVKPAATAP